MGQGQEPRPHHPEAGICQVAELVPAIRLGPVAQLPSCPEVPSDRCQMEVACSAPSGRVECALPPPRLPPGAPTPVHALFETELRDPRAHGYARRTQHIVRGTNTGRSAACSLPNLLLQYFVITPGAPSAG